MRSIVIVREQIKLLKNPVAIPMDMRRELVRVAKRAVRNGENARRAVSERLRLRVASNPDAARRAAEYRARQDEIAARFAAIHAAEHAD